MPYPRITLHDFSAGQNSNDFELSLDANAAQQVTGLFVDRVGRLRYPGGMRRAMPALIGSPQGLTRHASDALSRIVVAAGGDVLAFDETSSAFQTLGSVNPFNDVSFASVYDRLFVADGDGELRAWGGDPLTGLTQAGIYPPVGVVTAAAGAAGSLTGAYQYYVTFQNAAGVESNPSVASAQVTPAAQQVDLSDIPVSPDPQVTRRNLYRLGGTASQSRFIAFIDDNVTTTYTDDIADADQSLTQMPTNRDVCLPGAKYLFRHKNRLWAANFTNLPYRLGYSTLGEPEYFPLVQTDSSTDGGYFDVDPEFLNPITGLCSTGSLLVIGRKQSIAVLLGDSSPEFTLREVARVGVASHRSMANCRGRVVFLGADGQVYTIDQSGVAQLSRPVERTLQAVPAVYYQDACAAFVDQRYLLVIPQGSGQTPLALAYDLRSGVWTDLSDRAYAATCLHGDGGTTLGSELLLGTAPGYVDPNNGGFYAGVMTALTSTDKTPLSAVWKSPVFDLGDQNAVKRAKRIRVEGSVSVAAGDPAPGILIQARYVAPNGVARQTARRYSFRSLSGVLLQTEVDPALAGQTLTLSIDGRITGGEINLVQLDYASLGGAGDGR